MVLSCLGSGSSGNCYLFSASDGVLLLECGISLPEIKKALKFKLRGIVGCLVSHEHRDHSKCLKDILGCGINVLALQEVFDSFGIANRAFCKVAQPMHGYKFGNFKVLCLPVAHDVPCLGFVISHPEMGKTLFVTDTMMLEYRIPGLNHIMLEANYADDILQDNIDSGLVPNSMRSRLMHSHMELNTAIDILRTNDLSDVSEIILVHLSGNNSNAMRFKAEAEGATGLPTYIARKGMEINLFKH